MIGTAELLELLYTAPERFASIRAVLRTGGGLAAMPLPVSELLELLDRLRLVVP